MIEKKLLIKELLKAYHTNGKFFRYYIGLDNPLARLVEDVKKPINNVLFLELPDFINILYSEYENLYLANPEEKKADSRYEWCDLEDGGGKFYRLKNGKNIIELLNQSAALSDLKKLSDALAGLKIVRGAQPELGAYTETFNAAINRLEEVVGGK